MAQQKPVLTQVEFLGILVTQENQLQVQVLILSPMVAEENCVLTQVDMEPFDGLQLGAICPH